LLEAEPRYKVEVTACVPDDFKAIQKTVTAWCDDLDLNIVLTAGGTGFGVRDCTPEVSLTAQVESRWLYSAIVVPQLTSPTPISFNINLSRLFCHSSIDRPPALRI